MVMDQSFFQKPARHMALDRMVCSLQRSLLLHLLGARSAQYLHGYSPEMPLESGKQAQWSENYKNARRGCRHVSDSCDDFCNPSPDVQRSRFSLFTNPQRTRRQPTRCLLNRFFTKRVWTYVVEILDSPL